jgi:hypothetical protein
MGHINPIANFGSSFSFEGAKDPSGKWTLDLSYAPNRSDFALLLLSGNFISWLHNRRLSYNGFII